MMLNSLNVGEKKIDDMRKRVQALQRIKKKENFNSLETAARVDQQIADARQQMKSERNVLQKMVKGWSND